MEKCYHSAQACGAVSRSLGRPGGQLQFPEQDGLRGQRGFTLIELMMVLVLAALLLGIGAPSFQESLQRNRLQSTVTRLSSTLSLARVEAITRVSPIAVCPSVNLSTCSGSSWETGYLVFVDDGAGAGTALDGLIGGDEELVRIVDPAADGITIRSVNFTSASAVIYQDDGQLLGTQGTLTVCDARGVGEARGIIVGATGQIRRTSDQDDPPDDIHEDDRGPGNALVCPS